MHRVTPKVFLVGETGLNPQGLMGYFEHLGPEGQRWLEEQTDRHLEEKDCSPSEFIVEVMGRLCYRSFAPGLNPNVKKIREGNDTYIGHILEVGHGSVLEHSVTNWIFADVSRVFTHEVVRHRAGVAISQESLRFVRLTDLGLWLPPEIEHDKVLVELFEKTFSTLEELQVTVAKHFGLDDEKSFDRKKKLTSAMRRVAPLGLATTIGMSFNFRALRHIIAMRTSEGAEAEIRLVFDEVAQIAKRRWPSIFQDFSCNDLGEWIPKDSKV